jgi:4-hydroxy-3-methylbut-2-enyl diphosphate reductase
MIVKRAAVMGPCMGVKRGLDLARSLAGSEGMVYTLGPLIHNPQAVAELRDQGVVPLSEDELDERVAHRTVVIRAHGVAPELKARIESLGGRVVDATCPRVIASQKRAAAYAKRGWTVVIAGDRDHGEVEGIAGHARESGGSDASWAVVGSAQEAEALQVEGPVAVIAQTTIRAEEYRAICAVLSRRFAIIEIVDSICPATAERQDALAELARVCDAIVVVGGRNSANTSRLYRAAVELGKAAWLIERATELPPEIFGYERVGLTSGASTPDSYVDEVEERLARGPG